MEKEWADLPKERQIAGGKETERRGESERGQRRSTNRQV